MSELTKARSWGTHKKTSSASQWRPQYHHQERWNWPETSQITRTNSGRSLKITWWGWGTYTNTTWDFQRSWWKTPQVSLMLWRISSQPVVVGGSIQISIVSIPSRYQYWIDTSLVRLILYFKFRSCLQWCGFSKEETARSPDSPLLCQRRAGTLCSPSSFLCLDVALSCESCDVT